MYKGKPVIDVHGHMSTPPHFRANAYNLIALRTPGEGAVPIPEAAMNNALERHLRMMDERNIDTQLLSPRPVAMMHWERPHIVEAWTKMTNDVIHQQCKLHPKRYVGISQLPQSPGLNIKPCVDELDRTIDELGFVGAILNPDPAGDRLSPGLDQEAWYPIYAKAEKMKATLIVHPSLTKDPRVEAIPHPYQYNNLTEETLATILLERGTVFERFPNLKIVICHCGGCLKRIMEIGDVLDANNTSREKDNVSHASGERAGGQAGAANIEEAPRRDLGNNLFFDTCVYDPWYLGAAIRQRGIRQMVFGTESPGAGSAALNPQTGKAQDDVLATLASFDFLSDEQRIQLVYDNPLRVFPLLKERGLF